MESGLLWKQPVNLRTVANKILYLISGCDGAGKTTASFTLLPEILECKEFINADEIAKGISPFNPESVAFEAGRIMLARFDALLLTDESFAIETTLSTRSYHEKIGLAKTRGFDVILLFFWLPSIDMAVKRVKTRVEEGGHFVEPAIIERRYKRGIVNLFSL